MLTTLYIMLFSIDLQFMRQIGPNKTCHGQSQVHTNSVCRTYPGLLGAVSKNFIREPLFIKMSPEPLICSFRAVSLATNNSELMQFKMRENN